MILYFVRHGETEFNKHHQLMGQRIDAPLDDKGLRQAHEVVAKLPKDFDVIYSSPLHRAAQTARIIADYFNKNIEIRDELKERDFGSLSGKTWTEIDQETGRSLSAADERLTYDYQEYGGESAEQVKTRLQTFLAGVKDKHGDGVVVVVTHFGIISLMNQLYPHKERHVLSNTSVHKFEI
jgi:broad specificity phosphatase PhoE